MAKSPRGDNVARQVGLILQRLDSITTLPEIATGFLSCMGEGKFDRSSLSNIIESDAALTSRIYSLIHDRRVRIEKGDSISKLLTKLPSSIVRDVILSIKVCGNYETDCQEVKKRLIDRKGLWIHSLATACCARKLGEIVLGPDESALAFSAGLLHDIGKLAIQDLMPKSFERLVQQAKTESDSLSNVEQDHLGLDEP